LKRIYVRILHPTHPNKRCPARPCRPLCCPLCCPLCLLVGKRLSDFFGADKEVKHPGAGDGVDVPSTPAERHLLATDTSDGDKGSGSDNERSEGDSGSDDGGEDGDDESAIVDVGDAAGRELAAGLLSLAARQD
jgi:hypothetical protein